MCSAISVPSASAIGDETSAGLTVYTDNVYYLRGDTAEISVFGNASMNYTLTIYDPLHNVIYQKNRQTDENGIDILNLPIQENLVSGTYTVKASTERGTATTWISIVEDTDYAPQGFPYERQHKGVNYTIKAKGFEAVSESGNITIEYPSLPMSFTVSSFANNMTFVERLKNIGLGVHVDLTYMFIHNGMKIMINGSVPSPRTYTFSFVNPKKLVKKLNNLRNGYLVFDWSDMKKAFSYDSLNGELTVNIPTTFRIDPYVFEAGFENDDFSEFTGTYEEGGTIQTSSDNPFSGSYHANATASGTYVRYAYAYKTGYNESTFFAGEYVYFHDTLPDTSSEDIEVLMMTNVSSGSATGLCQIGVRTIHPYWAGNYRNVTTWRSWYSADESGPSLNTWYWVEIGFHVHATEGWFKAYIEGEQIFSVTNIDTSQYGNIGGIRSGICYSYFPDTNETHRVDVDRVVADTSYIGPAFVNLNLKTVDQSGTTLSNTTVNMNNGTQHSTETTGGWANFTGIESGTTVSINASWIFSDFYVNNTFTYQVNSNTTMNVVCRAYNFTYNGQKRHVASDRDFNSATWNSSNKYWDLNFSSPIQEPHYIVFDTDRRPTYMLNVSYDQVSEWNGTSGVFKGVFYNETSTVRISFAAWGDTYLYRVGTSSQEEFRAKFTSVSLSEQNLTMVIGNFSDSGDDADWLYYKVVLYCGSRGNPPHYGGFITPVPSYDSETTLWTAYFKQSASSVNAYVNWIEGGEPSVPPGGSLKTPATSVRLFSSSVNLGQLLQSSQKLFTINITWTGVTELTLLKVEFPTTFLNWLKPVTTTPITFQRAIGSIYGHANIKVQINIPVDTSPEHYSIPMALYFTTKTATAQVGSPITFSVVEAELPPPPAPPPIPTTMAILLAITLGVVVVGSVIRKRQPL